MCEPHLACCRSLFDHHLCLDGFARNVRFPPQVDAYPDSSPRPAPYEPEHHRGALLHRPNRQRLYRQHHSLHPQDGDGRV